MTDTRDDLIRQAREMLEGVTDGPWISNDLHSGIYRRIETDAPGYPNDGWVIAAEILGPDAERNARFIAWCREGVPALIAELEKRNEG